MSIKKTTVPAHGGGSRLINTKHSLTVLMGVVLTFAALMPLQAPAAVLKILNPTPEANDRFGISVSPVGNNVLVRAGQDNTSGTDVGAAYLMDGTTGALLQTYLSPAVIPANFGRGVAAASGNELLINGSDQTNVFIDDGRFYRFDAVTGGLLQTYMSPNPNDPGAFGRPIAPQGNKILVGAELSKLAGPNASGAAYLLDAATGNELQIFLPPSPFIQQQFGGTVALTGDNVVIGTVGANSSEEVYVFSASTGALLHTIQSPNPNPEDNFGSRLAVDGNNILVGAYGDDTLGFHTGAAYLFNATTGNLLQTFLNPTPAFDLFGNAVAIQGNKVLVGANADDTLGINTGAAYLFDATTGELLDTILGTMPGDGSFGTNGAVGFLDDNRVIVGDPFDNTGAEKAGAVHVFDMVVPEPSMLMFSATTAVCLLGYGCRRKRKRAA